MEYAEKSTLFSRLLFSKTLYLTKWLIVLIFVLMKHAHQKILLESSSQPLPFYCDFLKAPGANSRTPFVLYFGGAISEEKYMNRMNSAPDRIFDEFIDALKHVQGSPPNLMVYPSLTVNEKVNAEHLENYFEQVINVILTELELVPKAFALVGNSYGGYLATLLTFSLPSALSLATFAGVGLLKALKMSHATLPQNKAVRCFLNDEDPCSSYGKEIVEHLKGQGMDAFSIERNGGHEFADYASNNSIRDAFIFSIRRVQYETGK